MEKQNSPPKEVNKLICEQCDYTCSKLRDYKIHTSTAKHIKNINGTQMEIDSFPPLILKKILCEVCHYKCNKESEFKKHINSLKHIKNINENINEKNNIYNIDSKSNLKCIRCNKQYKTASGIWKHNKTCINLDLSNKLINEDIEEETILDSSMNEFKALTELVIELVKNNTELQKQNQDFQKQVLEICKNNNNTVINSNNNNNSNNKTFNLQLFLNEECKDAMNMSDFINSIELKISDLENIGKLGYVEGMSSIIIRELNDTDMYKRPVHCSDAKRETVYVKEENKWEKDNKETKQMVKAVRGVDKKNYKLLTSWKEMDPKCVDSKSNQCDKYMKIMSKVMDGDIENVHKVIKKVAKEVLIDKS
jgi:hypothetical protein